MGKEKFAIRDLVFTSTSMLSVAVLVLPLILHVREDARENQCKERLGQLGKACLKYADGHNQMLPCNRRQPHLSWNTLVLPFMEKQELSDRYDASREWWEAPNRDVGETHLAELVCPSAPHGERMLRLLDPSGEQFQGAATDYVASSGAYLHKNVVDNLYRGAMASPGRLYGGSGVRATHAVRLPEILDGTSNTFLIVEMADKPNTWRAGELVQNQLESKEFRPIVEGFSFGQWVAPNWNHLRSYNLKGDEQFGPCGVNCSNQGSLYSFHPDFAHAVFADGSVRPIRAELEQEIMVALTSISDGEVVDAADFLLK